MLVEISDKLADSLRRVLVQRLRSIDVNEAAIKRKRSWRDSEKAMALAECIMQREAFTALQNALRAAVVNGTVSGIEARIADALGTAETGDNLVSVARDAHNAQLQLSSIKGLRERIAELNSDELAEIQSAVTAALEPDNGMEVHLAMKGAGLL